MPRDRERPPPGPAGTGGAAADGEPGRWLLNRLGMRRLRPGGVALTRWLLDTLAVGGRDRVVEFASASGATSRLILARHPQSYVEVDRDSIAVAVVSALDSTGGEVRGERAEAARTGLPDGCASVVYGDAMLTMQPEAGRRRVVAEAYRLLAPAGRYGIHELCLVPDDIAPALAEEITTALSDAFHVGARLQTMPEWRALVGDAGFTVVAEATVSMRLLEPSRLVADEGVLGAARIAIHMMRDAETRRRVLRMRRVLRSYRRHLAAVALVAVRS